MLKPTGVVTTTNSAPVPAGTIVVIVVSLMKLKEAGVPAKVTAVAPVNALPEIVTVIPANPVFGLSDAMTGSA